jgi:hypothetical protein
MSSLHREREREREVEREREREREREKERKSVKGVRERKSDRNEIQVASLFNDILSTNFPFLENLQHWSKKMIVIMAKSNLLLAISVKKVVPIQNNFTWNNEESLY